MEDLITDIVSSLVSDESKLENSLLKTKVLAYKIKNDKLATWVNNELNGYPDNNSLPDYRIFSGRVMGTMTDGYRVVSNTAIPLYHLDDKMVLDLTQFHIKDGIGSLEVMANETSGFLSITLPPEVCALINIKIPTNGYVVQFAQKELSSRAVKDILSTVKSKLLEFMLELENQFEVKLDLNEMKKGKEKVNDLVKTTIYGNNNVIIAGDNNKQEVSYRIKTNDIKDLIAYLESAGVPKDDISEIQQIVVQEKPDFEKKQFGPKVREWMKKLTAKAVDGVWQVSLSSAGQILGNALTQYYGL